MKRVILLLPFLILFVGMFLLSGCDIKSTYTTPKTQRVLTLPSLEGIIQSAMFKKGLVLSSGSNLKNGEMLFYGGLQAGIMKQYYNVFIYITPLETKQYDIEVSIKTGANDYSATLHSVPGDILREVAYVIESETWKEMDWQKLEIKIDR